MNRIRTTIIALLTIAVAFGLMASPASAHHDGDDYPPLAYRMDIGGETWGSVSESWLKTEAEGVNRFDLADIGTDWYLYAQGNEHAHSLRITVNGDVGNIQNINPPTNSTAYILPFGAPLNWSTGTYVIEVDAWSGSNGTGEQGPTMTFIVEVTRTYTVSWDHPFTPEPNPFLPQTPQLPWWWSGFGF